AFGPARPRRARHDGSQRVVSAGMDAIPPSVDPNRRGRVLVAEGERPLQRAVARALQAAGFDGPTAGKGGAAPDLLAASDFDAIVSDIRMPDMDGVQLLRSVREQNLEVPVILVTGSPGVDTAQQAIEFGAFRYVTKPVQLKTLEGTVRAAVRLRQ